jgi:WD40 repeat protein
MRALASRPLRAVAVVAVATVVAVLVNILTSRFNWWVLAAAVVAVAGWGAVEWWNASPARPAYSPPPSPPPDTVPRPSLVEHVVDLATAEPDGERRVVALHGFPGSGKTYLAQMVVADPRTRKRFPERIFWITLRQDQLGPALGQAVLSVAAQIVGEAPPPIVDPRAAGAHLAHVLQRERPTLLVIDDVWTAEQLEPFLHGAPQCVRLVTTRVVTAIPSHATRVKVGEVTPSEAAALLTEKVGPIPDRQQRILLDLAAGMPLALILVNRWLVDRVGDGVSSGEAADLLIDQVRGKGIRAVERGAGATDRTASVVATVGLSVQLLERDERDRFADLGVFTEGADIPSWLVAGVWHQTGALTDAQADLLVDRLANVALVDVDRTGRFVAIHDVIRACALDALGIGGPAAHARLLATAAARLPGTGGDTGPGPSWWALPDGETYLWLNVVKHLCGAHPDTDAAETLVTDPRWVARKLELFGLAAIVADLDVTGGAKATSLRRVLDAAADLLAPTDPSHAVRHILLSRLPDGSDRSSVVDAVTDGDQPHLVPVWPLPDLPDSALRRTVEAHGGAVHALVVAPDGSWYASTANAGSGGSVKIWDTATGFLRHELNTARPQRTLAVSLDGGWLAGGGYESNITLWDTATWRLLAPLTARNGGVRALSASQTGDLLAAVDADGDAVRLWRSTVALPAETGGQSEVVAVALAPDGTWYAAAGGARVVWVRRVDGSLTTRLEPRDAVKALAVSSDGRWLLGADDTGYLHRWSTAEWAYERIWSSAGAVTAFAPDGTWFASAREDRSNFIDHRIVVGDTTGNSDTVDLRGHLWAVQALAIEPGGNWLVSGDINGYVRMWDRPLAGHRTRPDPVTAFSYDAAFTPDGARVFTGHRAGLRVTDIASRQVVQLEGAGMTRAVAVSPDGAWAAAAGRDGVLSRWDVATGQRMDVVSVGAEVNTVLIRAEDGSVAVGGDGARVRILHLATQQVHAVELPESGRGTNTRVDCLASGPDGTIACTDNDGYVHLLDADGTPRRTFACSPGHPVFEVDVARIGGWFAAGGSDGRIRIWYLDEDQPRRTLAGHQAMVAGLAISPDERWLASCDNDGVILVWETGTWTRATVMRTHGYLHKCRWSPNGELLAVTSGLGVYLFAFRS